MASPQYPICEVIQVEKSELKRFLEKQTQHKVEALIPEGLKVAKVYKPRTALNATSKADLESTGPMADKAPKSIVEKLTTQVALLSFLIAQLVFSLLA